MNDIRQETQSKRFAGVVMAAGAAVSVFTMAHHPTGVDHVAIANAVHAVMISITILLLAGFSYFTVSRDTLHFLDIAGLGAYAVAAIANIFAAITSGFIVPMLVNRGVGSDIFAFTWAFNQSLAKGAVYMTGAAFAAWGLSLVLNGKGIDRLLGVAGVVAGVAPAAILAFNIVDMNVAGAFIIYTVHALFVIAVGLRMAMSNPQ